MNKLIRELAIQSGLPTALDYHQKRYEKFAELLIQECAQVADLADSVGCEWIGGNILTHFGVEQ